VSDTISFQCRRREYILACLVVSSALMGIHFYLLGVYTAAAIGVISVARFLLSIFYVQRWLMWLFLFLTLVVAAATYSGVLTLLSATATSCFTIGAFQKNDKRLRLLSMCAVILWITHNVLAGSYMGVLLECVFLVSCVIGYYRFYIRRNYLENL